MAYIANKPVRFDRDYKVGEVIPDAVIAPSMTRKLMEMGRILHVDLPAPGGNAESPPSPAPEDTQDGAGGEGGTITPKEAEPPAEGGLTVEDLIAGTVGEFVCDTCGRAFQTQQGLAAHIRSHKD